jgi:hypothetical protein
MPIDLSWYSCNARGISTLEQYQRRQDGIIVSAIEPRTATVGTRMRPHHRSRIDQKIHRRLPIHILPQIFTNQENITFSWL